MLLSEKPKYRLLTQPGGVLLAESWRSLKEQRPGESLGIVNLVLSEKHNKELEISTYSTVMSSAGDLASVSSWSILTEPPADRTAKGELSAG